MGIPFPCPRCESENMVAVFVRVAFTLDRFSGKLLATPGRRPVVKQCVNCGWQYVFKEFQEETPNDRRM